MACAGQMGEEEVLKLAGEAGLNEKAFAEAFQSPDTVSLASSLAAACRSHAPYLSALQSVKLPICVGHLWTVIAAQTSSFTCALEM